MSLLFLLNEVFACTFRFLDAARMSALKILCYELHRFYTSLDCIFSYGLIRSITLPSRKINGVELLGKVLECIFQMVYIRKMY